MNQGAGSTQAARDYLSPIQALLVSAFILSGVGQLLSGRKIRGALMTVATTLWLPVALIKLIRDLNLVLPELMQRSMAGDQVGLADLQTALAPMADGLMWIFLPLLAIWFWSLTDSIMYIIESKKRLRG